MNLRRWVTIALGLLAIGIGVAILAPKPIPKSKPSLQALDGVVVHPPMQPVRVPILMYHYVEVVQDPKDTIRRGLDILPSTLSVELRTLLNHGYTPIFMSDLAKYLDGKSTLPDKPVVLTFDDGYRDFYTNAYPVLEQYHIKATAYIVPGFLDKPNYMTKQQVIDVAASGIVEIAAHTMHHPNLKGIQPHLLTSEIDESKKELEQMIGRPVTDFAYPYGLYDTAAVMEVASAGFRTAVTTKPGVMQSPEYRFTLPRLRPGARTGDALITWLESIKV